MDNIELERLEEIRKLVNQLTAEALGERNKALLVANSELAERNRLLEVRIKAKKVALGLEDVPKYMFDPPDQQPNYKTAAVAMDLEADEVEW